MCRTCSASCRTCISGSRQLGEAEANALSVRTELQADCFAGIWANRTEKTGMLEAGDIDEALNAATAIGDDTLQREAQGHVVPDSFTHGTRSNGELVQARL